MSASFEPASGPSSLLHRLRERFRRVAIVHDWLTVPGGSEQVVLELLAMFPDAELFTSIYDPAPWPAEITGRAVHTSFLDRLPRSQRHYRLLLPLMDRAFRSFDLSRFDLVLSSSHACAKNVRVAPGTLHVCYCHTPMRYAWEKEFLAGEAGRPARLLLSPLLGWLRRRDLAGAQGPDVFIANSRHVAARIARYYGRSAEVVYPPVDVERFAGLAHPGGDYYLVFGRVVPYKRVDLAVLACLSAGRALKVAGDGRALARVKQTARSAARARGTEAPEVEFLGRVEDRELDRLMRGARALLFPGEEDFGIVPVEAQAGGVPVIAYGVGGAGESVLDGQTGVLFDRQETAALVSAIERFEGLELRDDLIRGNARRFSRERFREEIAAVIDRAAR